ncbi:MAG: non-canonical purine NTP pyrophosphatase, RdgB/HAM1 family [Candidatus Cloacimonadota bacterium]|nr:MAG: non-canonical purine NTP pyrophosphatase, RdgB/HAM1 family [Candidatus Cloacimonadota bacterium]
MKLLIASKNKDKIAEIKEILAETELEILSIDDIPPVPDVIENKETIQENAIKKAVETAISANMHTLADDTGLFVDSLDGRPGVYSARYAGENCSYEDNRKKMLQEMKGKENRKARFKTAVAFASPEGMIAIAEGKVEGQITEKETGENGFGYDAIFSADESGKTFGEMSNEEKHKISHRGRAFRNMLPEIKKYLQNLT